jgi:hypothetical protein
VCRYLKYPEKGWHRVHVIGIAQSLALVLAVCLATAVSLSLVMFALARMERATVPVRTRARGTGPRPSRPASSCRPVVGGYTYRPRGR